MVCAIELLVELDDSRLRRIVLQSRKVRLRAAQIPCLQVLPQLLEVLAELLHPVLHALRTVVK